MKALPWTENTLKIQHPYPPCPGKGVWGTQEDPNQLVPIPQDMDKDVEVSVEASLYRT